MATFQINTDEQYYLRGLPHLSILVYLYLRQHMDYKTGITGIARKVSLKSIAEHLYVEPHQGIRGGSPSEQQIRRALDWLEKAGLIKRNTLANRANKQSVFKLLLANTDYSVQNKADSKPTVEADSYPDSKPTVSEALNIQGLQQNEELKGSGKADNAKTQKADMPPISDIYNTTHNARAKYPMSLDWVPPDKNILRNLLLNAGLNKDNEIPIDIVREYRGYWAGRPDIFKTTHDWTHGLVIQFKNKLQRGKANANGKRSYRQRNDYSSTIERTATDTSWYYGRPDK